MEERTTVHVTRLPLQIRHLQIQVGRTNKVLYYIVLYCIVLYCVVLCCIVRDMWSTTVYL